MHGITIETDSPLTKIVVFPFSKICTDLAQYHRIEDI